VGAGPQRRIQNKSLKPTLISVAYMYHEVLQSAYQKERRKWWTIRNYRRRPDGERPGTDHLTLASCQNHTKLECIITV